MLLRLRTQIKSNTQITRVEPVASTMQKETVTDASSEAEVRRQMYERMARGHALAEAEESASRKWRT